MSDHGVRSTPLARVRDAIRAENLDAYLAYTPSNVFYTSGYRSYFLSQWWRMHGTVMVLIAADERLEPAIVVSDFEEPAARHASGFEDVRAYRLWVESRPMHVLEDPSTARFVRPAQYDQDEIDALVRQLLEDRGLTAGRVGTDLRYILHHSYERLVTSCPEVAWVDATDVLYRVRSIKAPEEVEQLRRATELSEAGMRWACDRVREGMTSTQIGHLYTQGVIATVLDDPRYDRYTDSWVIPAVGPAVSPADDTRAAGLSSGDLIKFDCGTTVGGYRSDGGRTFAYRHVTPRARHVHDVLLGAHEAARALLRPGVPACRVFHAAQDHVRGNGFPGYTRGHIGHSVGIDTFHEEPPYLSPDEERPLAPGMVLAIETPFYGEDLGAIMLEDLVHITEDGHEVFHTLPYDLVTLGT